MPKEEISEAESRRLADLEIADLNRRFYSGYDTNYFLQKCLYLSALLKQPQAVSDTLAAGVEFKKLKFSVDAGDFLDKLPANLKAEIVQTYFHAIETLFRLMFAHSATTDFPWLELSTQTSFKKFKQNVEKFTKKKYFVIPHEEGIGSLFYGHRKRPEPVPADSWDKTIRNIDEYLNHFAKDLLQSYAYNSYKHGLAAFPDELGFNFGGPESMINVEKDDALFILSHEPDKKREGYNLLNRHFIFSRWETKFALVFQITQLIENIIAVGRVRYAKGELKELHSFDRVSLAQMLLDKENPFQPDSLKMSSISFERRD